MLSHFHPAQHNNSLCKSAKCRDDRGLRHSGLLGNDATNAGVNFTLLKKLIQLLMVYWSLQQYYRLKIIHSLMPHVLQHSIVTYIFYTHRNTMI